MEIDKKDELLKSYCYLSINVIVLAIEALENGPNNKHLIDITSTLVPLIGLGKQVRPELLPTFERLEKELKRVWK